MTAKRITAVLLILLLVLSAASAARLQLGAAARYIGDDLSGIADADEYKTFENYRFGGDVRLVFPCGNLTCGAIVNNYSPEAIDIAFSAGSNYRIPIAFLDINIGGGFEIPLVITEDSLTAAGESCCVPFLHAGLAVNIGKLSVSADYHLGIASFVEDLEDLYFDKQNGRLSFSVLLTLF